MGRPPRVAEGGLIYHTLNRANARLTLFEGEADYQAFERVLAEAVDRERMRLLAYCVMPDHFHLVVWPRDDGDLSRFMRWLTLTHTQRWHAQRRTAGAGHLYQGRFKSFPVQDDAHLHVVCRYIERNALRAGLVPRAEQWLWGSLSQGEEVSADPRPALTPWPIERPADWPERVNLPMTEVEEEAVRRSIQRGQPFGTSEWQAATSSRLGLESTFRPRGRPRTRPADTDSSAQG